MKAFAVALTALFAVSGSALACDTPTVGKLRLGDGGDVVTVTYYSLDDSAPRPFVIHATGQRGVLECYNSRILFADDVIAVDC